VSPRQSPISDRWFSTNFRPALTVRANSHDEVLALAANLLVGRAAYETARRLYPQDRIGYRCGARVIERSDREE